MLPKTKAIIVLIIYSLLFFFFLFGAYKFMGNTQASFSAPAGTLVAKTEELAGKLMQNGQIFHDPLFVYVTCANTSSCPLLVVDNVTQMLASPLCVLSSFAQSLQSDPSKYGHIAAVTSYCTFIEYPTTFARQLVSEDNTSALIVVDLNVSAAGMLEAASGPQSIVDALEKYLSETMPRQLRDQITVDTTSIIQVFHDLKSNMISDMLKVDAIAVPLASIALVLCLRSTRMAAVPIPNMLLSITMSMTILWPISYYSSISSFAPDILSGVLVAISIDFSLFICSRWKEFVVMARLRGLDITDAKVQFQITLDAAVCCAHNIICSGCAVAIALGFLLIVPVAAVSSVGLALLVGALTSVFVALTFQPALLLVFFDFFAQDKVFDWLLAKFPSLHDYFADPMLDEAGLIEEKVKEDIRTGKTSRTLAREASAIETPSNLSQGGANNSNTGDVNSSRTLNEQAFTQERLHINRDSNRNLNPDLINYPRSASQQNMSSSQVSASSRINVGAARASVTGAEFATTVDNLPNTPVGQATVALLALSPQEIARRAQAKSAWFRLSGWVLRHPYLTLLLVASALAPFMWLATTIRLSFDLALQTPAGSPYVETLTNVANRIGSGALSMPFYVTLDTGRPGGVASVVDVKIIGNLSVPVLEINNTVWTKMDALVRHLNTTMHQPFEKIMSFVQFPGMPSGFNSTDADLLLALAFLPVPQLTEYQLLFNRTVDATHRMALIYVSPTVNAFGSQSFEYCQSLRRAIDSFRDQADGVFEIGLFGASSDSCAILNKMNELLPLQLGLMCCAIFIVVFVAFRSVFLPAMMIITLAGPIAAAIGIGVLLFQHEPFNKIWIVPTDSFSWIVPTFLYAILAALGCDYSIFLLVRIEEYRSLGFKDDASIKRAVSRSGRVISFAGIIMLFSFVSLAAVPISMMSMFGLVCGICVMLDTFVARPLITPALISLAGRLGDRCGVDIIWWPRKFNVPKTRDEDDMTELDETNTSPKWLVRLLGGAELFGDVDSLEHASIMPRPSTMSSPNGKEMEGEYGSMHH